MITYLKTLRPEFALVCTKKDIHVLAHIAAHLDGKRWREEFAKEFSEADLDEVFNTLKHEARRVLKVYLNSERGLKAALYSPGLQDPKHLPATPPPDPGE